MTKADHLEAIKAALRAKGWTEQELALTRQGGAR
jgi:lambda repressor-like predicted transcriptional regulator